MGETLYSIVKCFTIEKLTEVGDTKEEVLVHVYRRVIIRDNESRILFLWMME